MRVMHQVEHCRDCPCADWEYSTCKHPLLKEPRDFSDALGEAEPPDWCPLRAGELLIQLVKK